jgi:hypothetical protein
VLGAARSHRLLALIRVDDRLDDIDIASVGGA